jgi:hypothetical protein
VLTAAANGIGGAYAITARTGGAGNVAFTLTNLTPPAIRGVVSVEHSQRGITAIALGFNESLEPNSAGNPGFYSLAAGVKKRHRLIFTKNTKISSVSYDSNAHTVTLKLAKPAKGKMQVTVHGGILATNGLLSSGDFTAVVK